MDGRQVLDQRKFLYIAAPAVGNRYSNRGWVKLRNFYDC
jgi:hypothetical protein